MIPNYNFEFVPTPLSAGGVGIYIDQRFKYIEKTSNEAYQALWVELHLPKKANMICGVVYRQHNSPEHFQEHFHETVEKLSASGKKSIFMGDTNLNLLRFHSCKHAQNFILSLQSFNFMPTRVHNNSYSLIDNIFKSNLEDYITSGNIISDLTDHFSQFCSLHSDKTIFKHHCHKNLAQEYSSYSKTELLHDLSHLDLIQAVSKNTDVNKSFSAFHNKLNNLLNKHAPLKPVLKRMITRLSKPWITNFRYALF